MVTLIDHSYIKFTQALVFKNNGVWKNGGTKSEVLGEVEAKIILIYLLFLFTLYSHVESDGILIYCL